MAFRIVVLGVACLACSCTNAPPNPAAPLLPYFIEATVNEVLLPPATATAAIADARVEVMEGPKAGAFCMTDSLGKCSMDPGLTGATGTQGPLLRCTRPGFLPSTGRFVIGYGVSKPTFTLARDTTPSFSADYDVTVTAAGSCAGLSPGNKTFVATATVSHPTNPAYVLFELPLPVKCNYLLGFVTPNSDVELYQDDDCDFPRPPGPLTIALPSSLQMTAEGTWKGPYVGPVWTLTHDGTIRVTGSGVNEICTAPDHKWELRKK